MSETSIIPSFWPIQGQWFGKSHWEHIDYKCEIRGETFKYSAIRDTSTGFIYFNDLTNSSFILRIKAIEVAAYAIAYMAEVIVYHTLRIVIVSVYYVAKAIFQAIRKSAVPEDQPSLLVQWKDEVKVSLKGIVRAPFYGLAMFFGSLYMIFDPLNGRKIVGTFEFEWNHKIPVTASVHLLVAHKDFSIKQVAQGKGGYYVPGCFQPIAESDVGTGVVFKAHQCGKTWGDSKILESRPISWLNFFVL